MITTNTVPAKPITPNMKVGDLLKEYPQLLEVLVAQSPHFTRLKNPILRRIHGRLVTLSQAAAIAGLDPAALVRTLNAAVGIIADDVPQANSFALSSMKGTPEPPWVSSAPTGAHLDAREDQRNHSDPFMRIMGAVPQVQEGQVFHLRNTFEPLPLYDVLGKRGFVAWSRQLGPEDWEIFFFKVGKGESGAADNGKAPQAVVAKPADVIDTEAPTATISIDVRELTPPQPMMRILDGLASLKPGEVLLVHHKRRPVYLYPKLAELGYTQKTIEKGPDAVEIYIRKAQ